MDYSIRDYLPEILPYSEIRTTDEIRYNTYRTEDGSVVGESEYTLSKAPFHKIESVTATVNQQETELIRGTDWEEGGDEVLRFLDGTRPDADTLFEVQYIADSILSRFIESVEGKTDEIDEGVGIDSIGDVNKDTIITSKYISSASGEELDEIGKIFGQLGRRNGRSDSKYRVYLSSIANVYNGRGTRASVAKAIAAVASSNTVEITSDDLTFREYFNENEYAIKFDRFTKHRVSLLFEVAELADPSGVRFVGPIYDTGETEAYIKEGPPVDIEESSFDSEDEVPRDFIDPIGEKILTNETADIFKDTVEREVIRPEDFVWAHQDIESEAGARGSDWNQFQWDDGTWDSPTKVEWEITGDFWEFADWTDLPL